MHSNVNSFMKITVRFQKGFHLLDYTYGYEKLQSVPLFQFLTDQLALFESGGEIEPTPLLYSPRISTFVYGPAQSISINQKAWM